MIDGSGSKRYGAQHEIHLRDLRRSAPETWQPPIGQPLSSCTPVREHTGTGTYANNENGLY